MDSQENTIRFDNMDKLKRHLYQKYRISRIFRLTIEDNKFPRIVKEEDESVGEEDLGVYGISERHEVFARYHNYIVGHLGAQEVILAPPLLCVKTFQIGLASVGYARRSSINAHQTGRIKWSIIYILSLHLLLYMQIRSVR